MLQKTILPQRHRGTEKGNNDVNHIEQRQETFFFAFRFPTLFPVVLGALCVSVVSLPGGRTLDLCGTGALACDSLDSMYGALP